MCMLEVGGYLPSSGHYSFSVRDLYLNLAMRWAYKVKRSSLTQRGMSGFLCNFCEMGGMEELSL